MSANKTGRLIAELRTRQGMTQAELAERLGVTSKAVSRWETGRGYPDVEVLPLIAKEFSVSVDDLLGGIDGDGRKYVPSYAKDDWKINSGEKHDAAEEDPMEAFDRRIRRKGGGICMAVALWMVLRQTIGLLTSFDLAGIINTLIVVLMAVGLLYCGYSWLRYVAYLPLLVLDSYRVLGLMLNMAPEFQDVSQNMQDTVHLLMALLCAAIIAANVAAIILLTQSESVKDFLYTRRNK